MKSDLTVAWYLKVSFPIFYIYFWRIFCEVVAAYLSFISSASFYFLLFFKIFFDLLLGISLRPLNDRQIYIIKYNTLFGYAIDYSHFEHEVIYGNSLLEIKGVSYSIRYLACSKHLFVVLIKDLSLFYCNFIIEHLGDALKMSYSIKR